MNNYTQTVVTVEKPTIFQKIKKWITGRVSAVIFGITIISTVYFIVNSICKGLNLISKSKQATDCDSFKYKVLNFTNVCALIIVAVFTLPPYIQKLTEKYQVMDENESF